ncbi:MAG: sigma-70 family RNA polymerase sigma factor [Kofleriaceae bacterium]
MEQTDPALRQLATEMAWMRRLARALMRDGDADDLAQDAWIVAHERAPAAKPGDDEDGEDAVNRPWLRRVMVNLTRMRARSRRRRHVREERTADLVPPQARPDELVERLEMQQLVASEVLALDEPYRSTVLLHYFEELSCAEIARRLGAPEGTVRRRLKVALDHLRARLSSKRRGGLLALAPLAGITHSPPVPSALGVIAMKKLVAVIVVLILLIVAGVWWKARDVGSSSTSPTVTQQGSGARATSTATGATSASGDGDDVPAWLAQTDARSRRVAGRVVFRGAPVAGASVELASLVSESGLVNAPKRVTNAAGEFDFGMQRAMPWSVRASSPGKVSARLDIDLRDPRATPAPDQLELELGSCTAAMVGTVRDASGGPIANARIAPLGDRSQLVLGGPAAKTDDKGAYELCLETRWPGWVVVEVSADSYAAITYQIVVPGRITVDFALVPEATITGRVIRDDDGTAVPYAYVFAPAGPRNVESTPLRGAFTDASGMFRLDRMAAGRHLVFARADGLAEPTRGTPVVLGVGQTSVEIEIRLEVASTISGKVIANDKPVGGARVIAMDAAGHASANAVSQEDGTFVLAGVPRGETRFVARPYEVTAPRTFEVTRAHHEVTLEVESLGTIVGHVVRDKEPVPGALLYITGPNEGELDTVRTDKKGYFEAHGLQPGPWVLYADNDRGGAFGRAPETVKLARGETKEVTIDLAFAGSISGRVVDQTGAPVAGVTVQFRNTSTDDAGVTATADDGTFRATKMTGGGQYRVAVRRNLLSRANLRPVAGGEFPMITLADGASDVTGVVLAVQIDHLSIAGKVVDSDGSPVSDARVIAQLVDGNETSMFDAGFQDPADTTAVDGHFSIPDLAGGTYDVRARSPDGVEVTLASIRAGRTDVSIVLPAAGGIEVATVGFKSTPQVTALRSGASHFTAPITGSVQGGTFAMRSVSPGTYVVTARTPNEAATATVEVTAGKTSRVTLTSGGSGVVAGHVREFHTNEPIEGMTCRVLPRTDEVATDVPVREGVRTDARGAFLLTNVPAGPIAVGCEGLWRSHSDGLRMLTLQPGQRADVDVPVVRWADDAILTLGSLGAELDPRALVPQLIRITPEGPAATAGIREGDIIIAVAGESVTELSPEGAFGLIVNRAPGSKVPIGLLRGSSKVDAVVTLGRTAR